MSLPKLSRPVAATALGLALVSISAEHLPGLQSRSGAYNVVPVRGGATLKGEVVFSGEVPPPRQLLITRDLEICGEGYRERREVAVAEGGGLRNVVVFIAEIEEGKDWPAVPEGYLLDQKDCYFAPYLQVVPRGAELVIGNSDPVLHNIHAHELTEGARRTLFNLAQPEEGTIVQRIRPRRGREIGLECDAHDFMLGWIFAADNPYAVVVDASGRFAIDDIPPGSYTVTAWHPHLGIQERRITLSADGTGDISFRFTSP